VSVKEKEKENCLVGLFLQMRCADVPNMWERICDEEDWAVNV